MVGRRCGIDKYGITENLETFKIESSNCLQREAMKKLVDAIVIQPTGSVKVESSGARTSDNE